MENHGINKNSPSGYYRYWTTPKGGRDLAYLSVPETWNTEYTVKVDGSRLSAADREYAKRQREYILSSQ